MNQENNTDISESKQRQLAGLKPFPKGVSGNPLGRPKDSVSAITRVKQIFADNPEEFETFVRQYIKDPHNRQHIVEMLDGKPQGAGTTNNFGEGSQVIQLLNGQSLPRTCKYCGKET